MKTTAIRNGILQTILLASFAVLGSAQAQSNIDSSNPASVSSWGSGFNASFEYEITAADTAGGALREWRVEIGTSGGLQITNAWISGYNGQTQSNSGNESYILTNEGAGYIDELSAGEVLRISIGGTGSDYNANNVSLNFVSLSQNLPLVTGDGACPNPSSETLPFSFTGLGQHCWQITGDVTNVNSWGTDIIDINGADFTNRWSNSLPSGDTFTVLYNSENTWGHFEMNGTTAAQENVAPVAEAIAITATVGATTAINVIADYVSDDDAEDVVSLLIPQNQEEGTDYSTSGVIGYTPPAGTYGATVVIPYTVDDGNANNNLGLGTITITVDPRAYTEADIGTQRDGGGWIISVDDDGMGGLEAATMDVIDGDKTDFEWGCFGTNVDGIIDVAQNGNFTDHNDPDITGGEANTDVMLSVPCLSFAGEPAAAQLASSYVWPDGLSDGFLPDIDTLDLMYTNLFLENLGGFDNRFYWSSSEAGVSEARNILFTKGFDSVFSGGLNSGFQAPSGQKFFSFRVRAVRAF